ncbi:MAG: MBL fold metallo-hydrolase [bacterium]
MDVGQADAILILSPDGRGVLIDGGDRDSGIVDYLRSQGVSSLDVMVATHPHADHISGLVDVLRSLSVAGVVTNGAEHTTLTYERFLDAIIAAGAPYSEVRRGDTLEVGLLKFDVLHPSGLTGDLNNDSIVLRLVYGDIVFLFTGDAEGEAERSLVASGQKLDSTVLKVGHHGSRSSTTSPFLEQVSPEVAVYSCATDNSYGHPHVDTLTALADVGADVYGTDVNGTVVITTGGTGYSVSVGREGQPSAPLPAATATPIPADTPVPTDAPAPTATTEPDRNYIGDGVWNCPTSMDGAAYTGSRKSDKFHYLGCHYVDRIYAENRICFASRSAAVNYGYVPCGVCKP